MTRGEFLVIAAAFSAKQPPNGVSLQLSLKPESSDLLAPVMFGVIVHNDANRSRTLLSPTSDAYVLRIRYGGPSGFVVWSSTAGHQPILLTRRTMIGTGTSPLAFQAWDTLDNDRHAVQSGSYVVEATLNGSIEGIVVPPAIAKFQLLAPVAISALQPGASSTISGDYLRAGTHAALRDASGSIALSRLLGLDAGARYVVRGRLDVTGDEPQFAVEHFAPAAEPL